MALVLSIFGGRLVQLQVIDDAAYAAAAKQQRLRSVPLPATRGDITTRGGALLATTVKRRTVYADPVLVRRVHDPRAVAAKLAPLLELPPAEIAEELRKPEDRYVVLKRYVAPRRADKIGGLSLAGIATEPARERSYPAGTLAANIVGFVQADGDGAAGLENGLDDVLAGRDGKKVVQIGMHGQQIAPAGTNRREPRPGRDVRLTIDRDMQYRAQRAITRQVRATQAERGSVIVMEPATGQILAMAVAPTFDPDHPGEVPSSYRDNPPLQHVFEPGSAAKILPIAAALEGRFSPTTPVTVPPVLRVAGETIHDAYRHGRIRMTLAGVLAKSSNIGTALIGQKVGATGVYRTMRGFGLGRPTGIDFPAASTGSLPPPEEWDGLRRYTIPFGQGVSVNAVQLASAYATIANGGVRVPPSLIAGGSAGAAEARRRVVSKKTAQQLTRILEVAASERGTGAQAQVPGYRVAGKTGTAQRVDPRCGCYRGHNAVFSGFAPASDPRLVVQAVLHNPQRGHSGGQVAAPVFRKVMSFGLKSEEIPPTGTEPSMPAKLPLRSR